MTMILIKNKLAAVLTAATLLFISFDCLAQLIIYPAPEGEKPSLDFTVKVNNQPVFVYQARVSAFPVNQVWPGYQRPIDQTEIASFTYFDFSGKVKVEITSTRDIKSVDIRPQSLKIKPDVKGNTVAFFLAEPCKFVIEINGWHNALHIFSGTPEKNPPQVNAPNVRYYGPGVHREGIIKLKNNETLYIAGGAIVHGVVEAIDVTNVKILGRGILDASTIGRFDAKDMIAVYNSSNVVIDGIICRDPHVWTIVPRKSKDVDIHDVKLIGLWRYNADGIDVCNSENVRINDCFIRSFDDSIVLKGLHYKDDSTDTRSVKNVEVADCVIWNDWGRALEFGAETVTDTMTNVTFKNIDIIHYVHIAMDIQNGDRAVVHNVKFDDIRVEEPIVQNAQIADRQQKPEDLGRLFEMNIRHNVWSHDTIRGKINDIFFKNITFTGSTSPKSILIGLDNQHLIQNIIFENVIINGKKITTIEECKLSMNQFTRNVVFK